MQIHQPRDGYRAGLDAVLLAATVAAPTDGRLDVADLGAGVGTVGLCIAARLASARVTLVENSPALAALAEANTAANALEVRVRTICGDLTSPTGDLAAEDFDCVVANPPYQADGEGRAPPNPLKAGSHIMPAGGIDRWLRAAARLLRPRGTAIVIHRAAALHELLSAFDTRFGAIRVLPIYPRAGDVAHRVIISGVKGSRAPLQVLSGLVVHENGSHDFTQRARDILRDGGSLQLPARDDAT